MASLAASEAATISASVEESAIVGCFFDPQLMAARWKVKTLPDVECFTAQSESLMPDTGCSHAEYRRPTSRWWEMPTGSAHSTKMSRGSGSSKLPRATSPSWRCAP